MNLDVYAISIIFLIFTFFSKSNVFKYDLYIKQAFRKLGYKRKFLSMYFALYVTGNGGAGPEADRQQEYRISLGVHQ